MLSPARLLSCRTCFAESRATAVLPRSPASQFLTTRIIRKISPLSISSRAFKPLTLSSARFMSGSSIRFTFNNTVEASKMGSLSPHLRKHKVAVVGSGNWYAYDCWLQLECETGS